MTVSIASRGCRFPEIPETGQKRQVEDVVPKRDTSGRHVLVRVSVDCVRMWVMRLDTPKISPVFGPTLLFDSHGEYSSCLRQLVKGPTSVEDGRPKNTW